MKLTKLVFAIGLILSVTTARAADKIKLVTSTTDLAWAAKEIGGDLVEVRALLKGTENPHFVDAVPEFIRLASEAQAVCVVGLELEIGWMPKVLSRSMNAQVQPGGKGYCEVGKNIAVLERPAGSVDRSMGDVHPSGNPHFWLGPTVFGQAAAQIAEVLTTVDPTHVAEYQKGLASLREKLAAIQKRNEAKLKPFLTAAKPPVLIEYHKEFAYFLSAYGLKSIGSIEEKPGVTPSAGRLAEVALSSKTSGVRLALAAETSPRKTLEQFQELSGVPIVRVPLSVQPNGKIKDFGELQDAMVDAVVAVLSKSGQGR